MPTIDPELKAQLHAKYEELTGNAVPRNKSNDAEWIEAQIQELQETQQKVEDWEFVDKREEATVESEVETQSATKEVVEETNEDGEKIHEDREKRINEILEFYGISMKELAVKGADYLDKFPLNSKEKLKVIAHSKVVNRSEQKKLTLNKAFFPKNVTNIVDKYGLTGDEIQDFDALEAKIMEDYKEEKDTKEKTMLAEKKIEIEDVKKYIRTLYSKI